MYLLTFFSIIKKVNRIKVGYLNLMLNKLLLKIKLNSSTFKNKVKHKSKLDLIIKFIFSNKTWVYTKYFNLNLCFFY